MSVLFVKIGERRWMEQLLYAGRLRLRRLAFYAEHEDNAAIGDLDDGLLARYPRENGYVAVELETPQATWRCSPGSVTLRVHDPTRSHGVYCVSCLTPPENVLNTEYLRTTHLVDERIRLFGDSFVLFHDSPEFARRLSSAAVKIGHELELRPIEYVPNTFAGPMGPFRKVEGYAHQREGRFITTAPLSGEYLDLELGPLTDIGMLGHFAEDVEVDALPVESG